METTQARPVVRERMSTPWGMAQDVELIAPGIGTVSTAGHGGFKLSRERNAAMPAYMRRDGGWYEEDCEWSLVGLVFEAELRAWADKTTWTTGDFQVECAHRTSKNCYPREWERFTGRTLRPSESYVLKQEAFDRLNAERWIVISAITSKTRPGMVETYASIGGRRGVGGERRFYIPASDYSARGHFGYVIEDPSAFEEMV